ncbi:hypothetical protein [Ahrensia sp. R2A130]|uniref:hypothetical protein n=1 Tax=Ahrensia sp. R2A130 TaxID=744979 RepID=UPI0001E0A4D8|nr:hypothetical protein [Ahrensia sp. R2A130]EFL88229.1 hypothetical protein R2A130_2048 [Ahrensia sp. R2A130]
MSVFPTLQMSHISTLRKHWRYGLAGLTLLAGAGAAAPQAVAQPVAPGIEYYSSVISGRYDLAVAADTRAGQPSLSLTYKVTAPRDCLLPVFKARGLAWEHLCKFALDGGGYLNAKAALIRTGTTPPLYSGILTAPDGTQIARLSFDQNQQSLLTLRMLDNTSEFNDPRSLVNPGTISIGVPSNIPVVGSNDFAFGEARFNLETEKASFYFQRKPRSPGGSASMLPYDFGARMLPDAECPGPGPTWQTICAAAKSKPRGQTYRGTATLSAGTNPYRSAIMPNGGGVPLTNIGIEPDTGVMRLAPGWPRPEGFDHYARDFVVNANPNNIFVGQLTGFWQATSSAFPKLQYRFTPVDRTRVGVEVRTFYQNGCGPVAGLLKTMCEVLDKGGSATAKGELVGPGDGSGTYRGRLSFQNANGRSEPLDHLMELTLERGGEATVGLVSQGLTNAIAIRPIDNWDELDFEPSNAINLASVIGQWVSKAGPTETVYEMDVTQASGDTLNVVLQGFKEVGPYNPPNLTYARLEEKMDKDGSSLRTEFSITAGEKDWQGQMSWPNTFGPYDAGLSMYPRGGRLLLKLGERGTAEFEDGRVFTFRQGPMSDLSDQPVPAPPIEPNASATICPRVAAFVSQPMRFETVRHVLTAIGETASDDGKVRDCTSATALINSLGLTATGAEPWPENGNGTLVQQLSQSGNGGTVILKGSERSGTLTVDSYAGCAAETDPAICSQLAGSVGQALAISGVIPAGMKGYGLVQLGGAPHLAIIDATTTPKTFTIAQQTVLLTSPLGPDEPPKTNVAMCNGVEANVITRPTLADGTPIAICNQDGTCMDGASKDETALPIHLCIAYTEGYGLRGGGVRGPACITRGAVAPRSTQFNQRQGVAVLGLMTNSYDTPPDPRSSGASHVFCTDCEIVEELRCAN